MLRFLLFLIIVPSVLSAEVSPALGKWAWERLTAERDAPLADEKICFSGLDSIAVIVSVDKVIEETISKQRVKDKFELVLRKHGVPLSDSSYLYLRLRLDGIRTSDIAGRGLLVYTIDLSLIEQVTFYRNGEPYKRHVALWPDGAFGYAGSEVVSGVLLESIEAKAERVANLYLSANPR